MNNLGMGASLQFVDKNEHMASFNKEHVNYLKRIEESIDSVAYMNSLMTEFDMPVAVAKETEPFYKTFNTHLKENRAQEPQTYLDELETHVKEKSEKLRASNRTLSELRAKSATCREYIGGLEQIKPAIPDNFSLYADSSAEDSDSVAKFVYLCGVIKLDHKLKLMKGLWRTTRGNSLTEFYDIDPAKDDKGNFMELDNKGLPVFKTVFWVCYATGGSGTMTKRIRKLAEQFSAVFYSVPAEQKGFEDEITNQKETLRGLTKVTEETTHHLVGELEFLSASKFDSGVSYIEEMKMILLKERCIYENLDKPRSTDGGKLWHGSIWIPKYDADKVKAGLDNMIYSKDVKSHEKAILREKNWREMAHPPSPPTHFVVNEFTAPFQDIVTTYGVPRYREVNPGLWTCVSFPYQFGVMFGDIGHGGLLFLAGICLVVFNKQLKYGPLHAALYYRWLFFLMGGFAFFCGLTYNDFFAVPLRLFGSCYDEDFARHHEGCSVWMGIDPIWYQTKDEVAFINSLKMKLSIVIGVIHMSWGVLMRLFNNIHFDDWLSLIFEFIPYIVFFMCTFGYMVVCIIIKWTTNWDGMQPPPIINIYTAAGNAWEGFVLWGDDQGVAQTNFQQTMFLVAICVVPFMLFPKPILQHFVFNKKAPAHAVKADDELEERLMDDGDDVIPEPETHDEHNFAEDMIHQGIETIEFVLGVISNTASYLRLWALSLAHSQLAKVFLDMTIMGGVKAGSFVQVFLGFPIWFFATFAVLMCMDQMECFLHALRLHWVEFQNKFFKGDGYAFKPLSFEKYSVNGLVELSERQIQK